MYLSMTLSGSGISASEAPAVMSRSMPNATSVSSLTVSPGAIRSTGLIRASNEPVWVLLGMSLSSCSAAVADTADASSMLDAASRNTLFMISSPWLAVFPFVRWHNSTRRARIEGSGIMRNIYVRLAILLTQVVAFCAPVEAQPSENKFEIVEATIADIQNAIREKQLTATELVNMYLTRIEAYNGPCVDQPQGILGPVSPIPHAGNIDALITLNLRPAARKKWGLDDRNARSMTD